MILQIENIFSKISRILFAVIIGYSILFSMDYASDDHGNVYQKSTKYKHTVVDEFDGLEHEVIDNFVDFSDFIVFNIEDILLVFFICLSFFIITKFNITDDFSEMKVTKFLRPPRL